MSLEPALEQDEQPEGNYLFWALLGAALIIFLGSNAILSKMSERPELAAADPLLVSLLRWARTLALLGLGLLAGLLSWQALDARKKVVDHK